MFIFHTADVNVSVAAVISVGEEAGMVQVCAVLSAMNDTRRDFVISLTTRDGTGIVH